ncbi:RNA-binding protein 4.1-like [Syngnathoides biaculeatus]|uniref:RNA-binding protein 4.1-like n=1 Tax=Syngnathoides biaculeatus TaxID=300417 RepID=UPI002ADE2806|nr:RNA-binding protein 4.1-like [Syngnathoides biaculeatus]
MVKIFVGNLSPETTSDELRSLFSQYGKIAECSILKSFGFVHMDSKAEAEEAIRNLHQYQLNGQAMNVELSRGKTRGSTKLHVGNIACTNQELRAKFEEYGVVVECDIVKNYAFVHMERMEDAMEAINQLDNTAFKGKLMSVKLSTSRLRTAPGMGDRSGCYRCGQEGHWSKECPLDQNGYHRNGSEPNSDGFDASRFDGRAQNRAFQPGFSGAEGEFGAGYVPAPGVSRGAGHSSNVAAYRPGPGFENAARFGPHPGYAVSGAGAAYQGDGSFYGAVPGFPVRRSPYEERDPYGVVDYYGKYRANMYGAGFYEEQRAVPTPAPTASTTTPVMRERAASSSTDTFQCPQVPAAPATAPVAPFHTRDRSPIRRVPAEGEGYTFPGTQIPTVANTTNKYYL